MLLLLSIGCIGGSTSATGKEEVRAVLGVSLDVTFLVAVEDILK